METFRLWFKDDRDIPEFKQLAGEIVDVDVQDVIEKGIHPHSDNRANRTLTERFVQLLNSDQFKIKQLAELKHCHDIGSCHRDYCYTEYDQFTEFLRRVSQILRFVETTTYQRLLKLARQQLRRKWNHTLAKELALQVYVNFNDLRTFIKSKRQSVKLSSYDDLDHHDLADVLSPRDFDSEDELVIRQALPVTNFRTTAFLDRVTDDRGLLKLADSINDFVLLANERTPDYGHQQLSYNGRRKGCQIRLIPNLNHDPAVRYAAQSLADKWRINQGRYCFTTNMTKLCRMLQTGLFCIGFPGVNYTHKQEPGASSATVYKARIESYAIGGYLNSRDTGDRIKTVLRNHNVSMTGTKDKLLEKLAKLATTQYEKHEAEMTQHFKCNRFIKVDTGYGHTHRNFPILADTDLRNMLSTMFVIRHLRGNTILDAGYENDTYDLLSLARSLVKEGVTLTGCFLRVEE
ncbi:MAG: hypothetical protein ABII79_05535 [bacterium]